MRTIDPAAASGAIHNLLGFRNKHGRVSWVASHFNISRPTLYRLEQKFTMVCSQCPGRPKMSPEENEKQQLIKKIIELKKENVQLQEQLKQQQDKYLRCAERVKFFLISFGMPSRVIAKLIRECFKIRANRTDVLRQTQEYARRATQIMKEYFCPQARDVDLDEVFIEDLPLYIAAEPVSMAILKISKEDQTTKENWSLFLKEMLNLERTTSDRGRAILGAVFSRDDLVHQSDIFHFKRLLGTKLGRMERHCYKLIADEYKTQTRLLKCKTNGRDARGAAVRHNAARRKAREAIDLFDELEQAVDLAFEAFRFVTSDGKLNLVSKAKEHLELARLWINEHLPNGWSKQKRALEDKFLLTFLEEFEVALKTIQVQSPTPQDREYVLAALAKLWEDQANRRQRGRPVLIPQEVEQELTKYCSNLAEVKKQLFSILERLHRASSAVECINSRVGFYRYSKRRFSTDYANLIGVRHNLTPFEEGKREKKCPAKILGVNLPTYDLYELFGLN
jgi:hypothetical protein